MGGEQHSTVVPLVLTLNQKGESVVGSQCNNFPDLSDFYKIQEKEPTSTIFAERTCR